jgi:hypothetical protein
MLRRCSAVSGIRVKAGMIQWSEYPSTHQPAVHALNGRLICWHFGLNKPRLFCNRTSPLIPLAHAGQPTTGKVPTVGGVFSGLAVINSAVPAGKANRIRVVLFNVLSNQADLCCRLALVPIPNDILTVEGLTDLLNVVLQAAVRKRRS